MKLININFYKFFNPKILQQMKKFSLLLAMIIIGFSNIYAQSNKEEVDLLQAAFGMDKKAMVAGFVNVDPAQKDAFWKLYDEYETSRKENGKKRIGLLEEYAKNYKNMTPEAADKWVNDVVKLQTATDELIVDYYNKIKKATNAVVALQFYQIETYILTAIRMEVLEGIPFVGEKK
jgi:hypothetical protein